MASKCLFHSDDSVKDMRSSPSAQRQTNLTNKLPEGSKFDCSQWVRFQRLLSFEEGSGEAHVE